MKLLKQIHYLAILMFAVMNGVMLYLFLMQLPYGIEPLVLSLRHWDELSPQIGTAVSVAFVIALIAVIVPTRLSETWKNRLLYMRTKNEHPSSDAFLATRKQPFDRNTLLKAYPIVKDTAYDPAVQIETWKAINRKQSEVPVVRNTTIHWNMLRDLYLLSVVFLIVFLFGWAIRPGIPFQIVGAYVFLFGAQFLFFWLMAKRVGLKLVDNVLATALGIKAK